MNTLAVKNWQRFRPYALWPGIIWGIILTVLMLLPQDSFPESKLLSYDKLAHVGVFAILSILITFGAYLKWEGIHDKKVKRFTLLFCLFYGIALESLQSFVPGRMSDIYDFIANFTGGLLGLIVFSFFSKNKFANYKLIL